MADYKSKYTGPQIDEAVGKALGGALDGEDGVSPTVEVSKSGKVTTLTITDAEGTKTATITDGSDATVTKAAVEGALGCTYETWNFTLADGTTVSKKVVLV